MQENKLLIPGAILIAALLIGGSIIYSTVESNRTQNSPFLAPAQNPETIPVKPVSADDHILGSIDAKVLVVEYSDTECPFCKRFHTTMHTLLDTLKDKSTVAWVYRHFPLYKPDASGFVLHSKAGVEAESTECVAELGGNTAFWKYVDEMYRVTPSNNGFDLATMPTLAEQAGVDKAAFKACVDSKKYASKIDAAYNEARELGAQGTPYTVIVPKKAVKKATVNDLNEFFALSGKNLGGITPDKLGIIAQDGKVVLNGALPIEIVQGVVDILARD